MKLMKIGLAALLMIIWAVALPGVASAEWPDPKTYVPTIAQVEKYKAPFDDPRPLVKEYGPKQVLPKALYEKLTFDQGAMKKAWADVVGFKAPDVVGKIAPQIKPGKYTHKDVQGNAGFKDLMWPDLYNRIKPGGPPLIGNIGEFEIIPTKQYYHSLPLAEATKKNAGKTKLDAKGYIVDSTYVAGYPFPKPQGPQKAWQILYNFEKRYTNSGMDFWAFQHVFGFKGNLSIDYDGGGDMSSARLSGRVFEPLGWFDKRAETQGEQRSFCLNFMTPRDMAGSAWATIFYRSPEKDNLGLLYLSAIRRVRKMSGTDNQDAVNGGDQTYDDADMFTQKLSPTKFPYKVEVLTEREYLVPAHTEDASHYVVRKTGEMKNVKMERRPIYVLKLTQLDKTYVYSQRIFYIDQETFVCYHTENFDQRGRLYRTWDAITTFYPEMGMFNWHGAIHIQRDYVDNHSFYLSCGEYPAFYTRKDLAIEGKMKSK